jgi:hypothetical protein
VPSARSTSTPDRDAIDLIMARKLGRVAFTEVAAKWHDSCGKRIG